MRTRNSVTVANSVRRSVAKYEQHGVPGFFQLRKTCGATVLTAAVIAQAQTLLSQGRSQRQVAEQLNIRYDTVRKSVNQGWLITPLAYMALCRIKTVEPLQYESPGELGKLMGLDRVPEVRCLRNKLSQLSAADAADEWAGLLSQQRLEADPERTGTLYVDGHVWLYHGKQTELPRRYVSRNKASLGGI